MNLKKYSTEYLIERKKMLEEETQRVQHDYLTFPSKSVLGKSGLWAMFAISMHKLRRINEELKSREENVNEN